MRRTRMKAGSNAEEFGDMARIGGTTRMVHSSRLWLTNPRDRIRLWPPVPVQALLSKQDQRYPPRLRPVLPPVRQKHSECLNLECFPRGMLSGRLISQGHRLLCSHRYQGQTMHLPLLGSGRGVCLFLVKGPRRSYAVMPEDKVVNDKSVAQKGYRIGRKGSGSRRGLCSIRRTRNHVHGKDSKGPRGQSLMNLLLQARMV